MVPRFLVFFNYISSAPEGIAPNAENEKNISDNFNCFNC